jgi:hypothetical protein
MHVGNIVPAVAWHAVTRPQPDASSGPRIPRHLQPTRRSATDLRLVVGTVALVLGSAMVTVGLMPFADGVGHPEPLWPHVGREHHVAAAVPPPIAAGHALAQPTARPSGVERAPAWAVLTRGSAMAKWPSPLYPQNGITLWDRFLVSAKSDRRAFLLGSASQLHARATAAMLHSQLGLPARYGQPSIAATPGPPPISSSCCPLSFTRRCADPVPITPIMGTTLPVFPLDSVG